MSTLWRLATVFRLEWPPQQSSVAVSFVCSVYFPISPSRLVSNFRGSVHVEYIDVIQDERSGYGYRRVTRALQERHRIPERPAQIWVADITIGCPARIRLDRFDECGGSPVRSRAGKKFEENAEGCRGLIDCNSEYKAFALPDELSWQILNYKGLRAVEPFPASLPCATRMNSDVVTKADLQHLEAKHILYPLKCSFLSRNESMLNELEALAQKIGRLIDLNGQYRQTQSDLTQQLRQMRARCDDIQNALEQARHECAALRTERDALAVTIDEASAHLHTLLERLPQSSIPVETPARAEDHTYGEHA